MSKEVLSVLAPKKNDIILDATAGQGGHTALLAKSGAKVIALDADPEAVALAQKHAPKAQVCEGNFADIATLLNDTPISKALFDLGWNRGQLDSGRGFSFLHDEPLSMSYGTTPRSGFIAADILNTWSEKALSDVLFGYGEERYARRIAKAIVARRSEKPFKTTIELVEVVRDAVPASYRHSRLHPATRTFQALRIAVNDELRALEEGLTQTWRLLACNGRIAVITFHSIEDRLVKNIFKKIVTQGDARLLTKKPLTPSKEEVYANPSARSAKLRAIEKVCTP
jgi:16S rRNA (cytosine1402-N4)-methyltransferase